MTIFNFFVCNIGGIPCGYGLRDSGSGYYSATLPRERFIGNYFTELLLLIRSVRLSFLAIPNYNILLQQAIIL